MANARPWSAIIGQACSRGLDLLLDLLYPPRCVVCDRFGAWFCPQCASEINPLPRPWCSVCGRPVIDAGLCIACRQGQSELAAARSVSWHVDPLREAVHALKYEGVRVVAGPLGQVMAQYWPQMGLQADVVVPVPLHQRRLRERGYNQSLLLARALSAQVGIPVQADVLVRERSTRAQVGLPARERWRNVEGAFRCLSTALAGRRVLLLDDVMTTGATLQSCAQALRSAGAAQVQALTLTRAVGEQDDLPAMP